MMLHVTRGETNSKPLTREDSQVLEGSTVNFKHESLFTSVKCTTDKWRREATQSL